MCAKEYPGFTLKKICICPSQILNLKLFLTKNLISLQKMYLGGLAMVKLIVDFAIHYFN
jgi:hypothetical protein